MSAPSRANSTATARPMPESAPVINAANLLQLAAAAVVRRHEARRQREVGFAPGLGQVLRRQLLGLLARAGLHRARLFLARGAT